MLRFPLKGSLMVEMYRLPQEIKLTGEFPGPSSRALAHRRSQAVPASVASGPALHLPERRPALPPVPSCLDRGASGHAGRGGPSLERAPPRRGSDALRLAVALGIDITFKAFGDDEVMTSDSGDRYCRRRT